MAKSQTFNIGIDHSSPDRCFIQVPVDLEYMKKQLDTVHSLSKRVKGYAEMTQAEHEEMEHLMGFMEHFIHGVFHVVAAYPTANRTTY